jgi:hypothetical protein
MRMSALVTTLRDTRGDVKASGIAPVTADNYTLYMSTLPDTADLTKLLDTLRATPLGRLDLDSIHCAEAAAYQLAREEPQWISISDARALLAFMSEDIVAAWVDKYGLLRGRRIPGQPLQVRLDDVLYRRAEHEGLAAFGPDDEGLTDEELRIEKELRGRNPWEHEEAGPSA